MKVSTKGRYGLRALVDLAVYSQESHVSLTNIAERQNISLNYLEQVFASLRKAGVVKSIKGAQGGYCLALPPEDIKVITILRTLEGEFNIIDETIYGGNSLDSIQLAVKNLVWDRINEKVIGYVESITLEKLAEEYKKLNQIEPILYYI